MNKREHRIRALAYLIYQSSGRQDDQANWYQAQAIVDAYPSHDFRVERRGSKAVILLANKDHQYGQIPI